MISRLTVNPGSIKPGLNKDWSVGVHTNMMGRGDSGIRGRDPSTCNGSDGSFISYNIAHLLLSYNISNLQL